MIGPYTSKQLHCSNKQRSFKSDAREAAFLVGGIGTGNISVGARGDLRDFEIFNNPGKGEHPPYTFFAIYAKPKGAKPVVRMLEAEMAPPFISSNGLGSHTLAGLPHLKGATLRGEYPFAWVDFRDDELPVKVKMESFNPFIPLNTDDSSLPLAVVRYTVSNPTKKAVDVSVVCSMGNLIGHILKATNPWSRMQIPQTPENEIRQQDGITGLYLTSPQMKEGDLRYGNMAVMVTGDNVTHKAKWVNASWWDGAHDFWDDFCADGKLEPTSDYGKLGIEMGKDRNRIGSVGNYATLKPGEERTFQFLITWFFPNRPKYWESNCAIDDTPELAKTRNYYATKFADSWAVGKYALQNMPRLESQSRDFHRALYTTTMPSYVLEALGAGITVLRSPTCFRLEDGTFCGWEGCFETGGCCNGTCTHVWNYAQTVAFLFPDLEKTMRRVEFGLETDEKGHMAFRTERVYGRDRWKYHPAADGQNGTIMRFYREWKLTGDDAFLKELWPGVTRALEFAFDYWDADKDFVLDSQQHNTYDIEFYGPNSLSNSMFFGALKAGIEMARHLGDNDLADKWQNAFDLGSSRMDKMLWGGEYYIQKLEDVNAYRYQYGKGCLADQLLGQFLAHVTGLGHILPEKHVKKAMASIYKYNFRSMRGHANVQRVYALNDEWGLLLGAWPKGGRPRFPFVYSDEVWTGIEYQVASTLIYEGLVDEGLAVSKAVRDRHDGYNRSPWNEFECGHHYARSMASWGLLLALSGYKFDMVKKTMSFAPVINQNNFSTFWSNGKAWGIYTQKQKGKGKNAAVESTLEVLYGDLGDVAVNE